MVVLCHTRELAFQICHEYERFTTYMKARGGCGGQPSWRRGVTEGAPALPACEALDRSQGELQGARWQLQKWEGAQHSCCSCCLCCRWRGSWVFAGRPAPAVAPSDRPHACRPIPSSPVVRPLLQNVRVGNFFGGLPIKQQREQLKDKDKCPHIIVGTPGRVKGVRRRRC